MDFSNKMVLITGASSGIGEAFARAFAAKGCHLILVARRSERLHALAGELGVPCEVLPADLSEEDEVNRIAEIAGDQNVQVLINCAGFGILGAETDIALEDELRMIDLNIRAVHILTKRFLPRLTEKGEGAILNVASSAGLLPAGPYLNTYYATKAYVASFTQGLAEELKEQGSNVYVGALCPGPVMTEFTKAARGSEWDKGLSAEEVVAYALRKMQKKTRVIVPGFSVRAGLFFSRFLPKKTVARFLAKFQKKKVIEKSA
ncbi:MAG: SDR family oxidoreductase [Lachnospiraceae bacterium]|nr:SDR family oxidoreductase [Lachnospiraceae bacterium]